VGQAARATSQSERRRRDGVRRHIDQLLSRRLALLDDLAEATVDERAKIKAQIEAVDQQVERLVDAVRRQSAPEVSADGRVVGVDRGP
jgi:ElaB/YqjD/DUF883 family membrane-anchored ribosome-binding protein